MGNLLGSPNTEKETHTGRTPDGMPFGVSSMQGWRVHMEDAHVTEIQLHAGETPLPGHALFGVFDGHGGTFAAFYAGNNLSRVFSRQPKWIEYAKQLQQDTSSQESSVQLLKEALRDAFIEIDREIALALRGQKVADAVDGDTVASNHRSDPDDEDAIRLLQEEGDSGTTACVVLVTPNFVLCANAGDSRSVMSKQGGQVVELSLDHKPDDEDEEKRIRAAGGYVAGGRVEGDLAVSRGLGDFRFKSMDVVMASADDLKKLEDLQALVSKPEQQKVSPVPDIIVQNRDSSNDEFIIIACDGVWDVNTNEECIRIVSELFEEGESDVGLICEELCDLCLNKGSKDNMTALVVKMDAQKIGEGGGVMARRQKREEDEAERKAEEVNRNKKTLGANQ
ncbi:protein phosphatase 1B [Fistulifera solaris]|uniref:protein-serine/threonine phosphatase n=1 Tax=Fistulifera solaris TaxID=1519565 RepID=A0A1Z5J766_FISSO|nr:protein phosphatase 1B [Fistulifera solaris]|eukprot:GAX09810.1 protein phosphatase 1B [Fistulifera solaris]